MSGIIVSAAGVTSCGSFIGRCCFCSSFVSIFGFGLVASIKCPQVIMRRCVRSDAPEPMMLVGGDHMHAYVATGFAAPTESSLAPRRLVSAEDASSALVRTRGVRQCWSAVRAEMPYLPNTQALIRLIDWALTDATVIAHGNRNAMIPPSTAPQ